MSAPTAQIALRVITPGRVLVDTDVEKVTAEAIDGSFTLLPRHVDFAAPLVAGLLVYHRGGRDHVLAVDGGVLVKQRHEVTVATPEAVRADDPETLRSELASSLHEVDERERQSRRAIAHLETDALRRLIDLDDDV